LIRFLVSGPRLMRWSDAGAKRRVPRSCVTKCQ
jgi:hypothetical protein